jgi:hypothetical protein
MAGRGIHLLRFGSGSFQTSRAQGRQARSQHRFSIGSWNGKDLGEDIDCLAPSRELQAKQGIRVEGGGVREGRGGRDQSPEFRDPLLEFIEEVESDELTEGRVEGSVIIEVVSKVFVRGWDRQGSITSSVVELCVVIDLMVALVQIDEETWKTKGCNEESEWVRVEMVGISPQAIERRGTLWATEHLELVDLLIEGVQSLLVSEEPQGFDVRKGFFQIWERSVSRFI